MNNEDQQKISQADQRASKLTFRLERDFSEFCRAGQHFAIDAEFAQTANDEMRILRTEIQYEAVLA